MLADVVERLACPVCAEPLLLAEKALRCARGHAFDIARQGYANLLPGNARPGTADTAEMVSAREDFLVTGRFAPMADVLSEIVTAEPGIGCVLDAGAGTGYYLSAVLRPLEHAAGIALDLSKYAARRAARAHPRIGAVVADLWRPLPIRAGSVDAIVNVFAPRNAAEFQRVLRPGGLLITVTPSPRHLGPLVEALGLVTVDEQKNERVDSALGAHFTLEARRPLEYQATLDHTETEALVRMGPSAHHVPADELRRRLSTLPEPVTTPLSFVISTFRPTK
ncbi:rRNA (guanine-N1)-methyltransferase [Actinomadura sp. NBRC 104425]|uniref:putative RNA methyltransferase n=1 Tax=Actinomadura sp. NBRC 104425 TaxID=3032204 RepID=UPI0024A1EB1A|nr:methyltransferase domain-containing protein [Actinomadura sp. NBRC 104425]GLZ14567.1 rRNA (guanine-N1)-methyltransferase [Actinomadura sp. NBRC 104425]